MSSSYKPRDYNSVSPYLAVELRRFPGATGKLMHAEVL